MSNNNYLARKIVREVAPRFRQKRIKPLLEMIEEFYSKNGAVKVIDVGGTKQFWELVAPSLIENCNVVVRIINLPGVEEVRKEGRFEYEAGDGCSLSGVCNGEFDIAFSNSVIEHVGGWHRMRQFANEIRRVAACYFVQTPNFWFPIEPHCMTPFFHWLPFATRVWVLMHFNCGHWRGRRTVDAAVATAESAKLLNAKMMQELFPEAVLRKERLLFLPKSLMAIKR